MNNYTISVIAIILLAVLIAAFWIITRKRAAAMAIEDLRILQENQRWEKDLLSRGSAAPAPVIIGRLTAAPTTAQADRESRDRWNASLPPLAELALILAGEAGGGAVTDRQAGALKTMGWSEGLEHFDKGRASALLSARGYAEAVILAMPPTTPRGANWRATQTRLAIFLLRDDAMRKRVLDWSYRSFRRNQGGASRPKRDDTFNKALAEAERLFKG